MIACDVTHAPTLACAAPPPWWFVCRWCGRELVRPAMHAAIGTVMCPRGDMFSRRCGSAPTIRDPEGWFDVPCVEVSRA